MRFHAPFGLIDDLPGPDKGEDVRRLSAVGREFQLISNIAQGRCGGALGGAFVAEPSDRIVIESSQEERAKSAPASLGLGEEILLDDLVGHKTLNQIVGGIRGDSL